MTTFDGKITKAILRSHSVIFYPETEAEAEKILRRLFDMDFVWGATKVEEQKELGGFKECVDTGLCVTQGEIYWGPNLQTRTEAIIGNLDQLQDNYLSIHDRFNLLSEKVEILEKENAEQKQMIKELHDQIIPKDDNIFKFGPK